MPRIGARYAPYVRRKLRAAIRVLKPAALRELSIVLVNDQQMSRLHRQFMSISGPTDVLTFPMEFDAAGRAVSGEIVICVPQARRSAAEHGNNVRDELLLYALHGLLHLCGWDDRTDRQYRRMHRMEDAILRRIGVGPVFYGRVRRSDRRASRGSDARHTRKGRRL
ncbi:rRNA maturation RNase YbeY [Fontivita pretiosa]|uniref:rRNA maturation RNase YbeY n=1 Tax=Fontivita pretiosa TaxID=2989684 RepID=UPI003D16D2C9